ncbi:ATP-dependent Clp protease ATP-binding subunit [Microbispora sp. SCL1-1]|uniref:Clp protease N-terminal domain-containing protein n=1 Tax=Microbispora TaxID=2005 RepID=UPI001157355E|nr:MULTISPECIES: Clp protease N-terminal domain-containing protein [unclassified Microbispora]NJP28369.1 ATP-dependent Clp protease ATP-binding subunit [Microbispora sp. CL1-1]TQS08414.1 ATP-dependent Clp protease ATP-binding subunit [Microbispora sp. SCL1-1]
MPKINVYLPDDLAEAVKDAALPVSAICQRALEQAVRRVSAIRESILGDFEIDDPRLSHFTPRTRAVFRLALEQARAENAAGIGTEHLLAAMLAEGRNLALHVLRAMEVEPALIERDLAARRPSAPTGPDQSGDEGTPKDGPSRFDAHAANALELAVTEAHALGHNYIGCEHLLLGLVAEPDGIGGQVLRERGAEPRLTRRAVVAALAGYVHLRAQAQDASASQSTAQASSQSAVQAVAAVVRQEIAPLMRRIERLEQHAGVAAEDGAA